MKAIYPFETYLRTQGMRARTTHTYVRLVLEFLTWCRQENINYKEVVYNDLLAYVQHLKSKQNKITTINHKLLAIEHFYTHLEEIGAAENPCGELRIKGHIRRQPHDLLEWEDLEKLYQNFPAYNLAGKRDKAILGLMIYQGLNGGEIAKLETKDVQLEKGKVYIPEWSRSNSRTLPLEATQIVQLQQYITRIRPTILHLNNKTSTQLFITMGSSSQIRNGLYWMSKKINATNPKIKSARQIRASVLTYWLQQYNIRQVQYMCGHRYVSSTERYQTNTLETLQEQVELLHPLK